MEAGITDEADEDAAEDGARGEAVLEGGGGFEEEAVLFEFFVFFHAG